MWRKPDWWSIWLPSREHHNRTINSNSNQNDNNFCVASYDISIYAETEWHYSTIDLFVLHNRQLIDPFNDNHNNEFPRQDEKLILNHLRASIQRCRHRSYARFQFDSWASTTVSTRWRAVPILQILSSLRVKRANSIPILIWHSSDMGMRDECCLVHPFFVVLCFVLLRWISSTYDFVIKLH